MKLTSQSLQQNKPIAAEFAFCVPDPDSHVALAPNRNPHLQWIEPPSATRSFVLICNDPDVPSRPDDVNQEGRTVAADLLRIDFYHWVLVDIPAHISSIDVGADADGVIARGKDPSPGPHGARRGLNSYTDWFAGDADMQGNYFGYDGPCPPWNDSIRHRYVFTLYALDCERCPVGGDFGGAQVLTAIEGHVLAKAEITVTYSLNPDVPA